MDDGRAEVPRGAGRGGDSRAETAKLPTQAPTSLEGKSPFYDLSCANIEAPLGISLGAITGGTTFFMGCSEAFEFAHVLLQQNPESWLLRTADALRAGPGQQRHRGDRCVSTRGPRARLPAPWEAASEGAKGHAGEREGWRADVDARRWDRKPRSGPGTLLRGLRDPSAGLEGRRSTGSESRGETFTRSHVLTHRAELERLRGPGLLVTGGLGQTEAGPSPGARPHAPGSPRLLTPRGAARSSLLWPEEYRLTYSPSPASSLAFSLWGRQDERKGACDSPRASAHGSGRPPPGLALP